MSIQINNKREQMITDENGEPIRGTWGAWILGRGTVPNLKFSYSTARNRLSSGGWAREVTVRELPVATKMAGVNMRLQPGGIREMHWHKEAEWGYVLAGRCRVTAD